MGNIKKSLLFFSLLFAIAAAVLAQAGLVMADEWNDRFDPPRPYVLKRGIAVRSGPGNHFEHRGTLPQGKTVMVYSIHRGWCEFIMPDGRPGHIFKRYLAPGGGAPEGEKPSPETVAGLEPALRGNGTEGKPEDAAGKTVDEKASAVKPEISEAEPEEIPGPEKKAELEKLEPEKKAETEEKPAPETKPEPVEKLESEKKPEPGDKAEPEKKPEPEPVKAESEPAPVKPEPEPGPVKQEVAPPVEEKPEEEAPAPELPPVAKVEETPVRPPDRFIPVQGDECFIYVDAPANGSINGSAGPDKPVCFRLLALEGQELDIALESEGDQARFTLQVPDQVVIAGADSYKHKVAKGGDKIITVSAPTPNTPFTLRVELR